MCQNQPIERIKSGSSVVIGCMLTQNGYLTEDSTKQTVMNRLGKRIKWCMIETTELKSNL